MSAAEDTRNLRHLMDIHGQLRGRRIIAYHDHNADRQRPAVLAALAEENRSPVSDAGTPLVADPGYRLAARRGRGVSWCARCPALRRHWLHFRFRACPATASFVGFPPSAGGARRKWIDSWREVEATVIVLKARGVLSRCWRISARLGQIELR